MAFLGSGFLGRSGVDVVFVVVGGIVCRGFRSMESRIKCIGLIRFLEFSGVEGTERTVFAPAQLFTEDGKDVIKPWEWRCTPFQKARLALSYNNQMKIILIGVIIRYYLLQFLPDLICGSN